MAKILIIDDESTIRLLTRTILEKEGHTVTEASDGNDGLKKANHTKPDLILLDVMMPDMQGWEVCEKIKSCGNLKDIPIIIFSVKAKKDDIELGDKLGADGYIAKPFAKEDLLDLVNKTLNKK